MSDDTRPSIAELEAAENELPRDWRYDHQGYIESLCRMLNHTGAETEVLVIGARNEHSDGEGIVALRNAAPALIAIAKAAQQWSESDWDFRSPAFKDIQQALKAVRP